MTKPRERNTPIPSFPIERRVKVGVHGAQRSQQHAPGNKRKLTLPSAINRIGPFASLIVALVFIVARPAMLSASCWASNPNGARTCSSFVNKYGLRLRLCEDEKGDCGKLGYRLNKRRAAISSDSPLREEKDPERNTNAEGAADGDTGVEETKPETQSEESETSSASSADGAAALLIVAVVIGAVILLGRVFGLGAGTSILAFVVGCVLGVFSGLNRRSRW